MPRQNTVRPASTSPLRHVAFLRPLVLMLVVAVLAGLVVAAIAIPVVAGLGVVAKTGATDWENLPDGLKPSALPTPSRILASDGSLLGEFYYQNRIPATLTQIPTVTQQALLAIEDSRFYYHHGIDFQGTIRALVSDVSGGSLQGGSTLTQQYVKNMLLYDAVDTAQAKAANETTLQRKIREARYALTLDKTLTKDQILDGYFNIAYFGESAYGIGAAAEHYFGIPVSQLTLDQSAMLVGMVQNPSAHDPVRHPANARNRRDTVLARMATVGFITPAQEATASAQPLRLHVTKQTDGCKADKAPYFCEWVVSSLESDATFGATKQDRIDALLKGGLTIRTTLNWKDEEAAEAALASHLPYQKSLNPRGIAGAEVVVDPKTGAVLAMTANQPFGPDAKIGQNLNPYATGASSGFQGGSTFKLFTMVTALEQGIPTSQVFNSPARYYSTVFPGYSKAKGGVGNAGDSEAGVFNMTQATAHSVNTYFVQLEEKVGVPAIVNTARTMGVDPNKFDKAPVTADEGSFTLGTREVSPLEMAGAYATLAAHGKYCTPYALQAVTGPEGKALPVQGPNCRQVLTPAIADTATELLTHVITDPGATAYKNGNIGRPAAGKTGTTNSNGAAWFDGFTPDLAASVWVGDPAGPNHLGGLAKLTIDGKYWTQIYGGDIPTMIWHDTMTAALSGVPVTPFTGLAAPGDTTNTTYVLVPPVIGQSSATATSYLNTVGLVTRIATVQVASPLPAGQVISAVPGPGVKVPTGSTVTLTVSSGIPPTPTLSPSPTVTKGKPVRPGKPTVAPTSTIVAPPTIPVVPPATGAGAVATTTAPAIAPSGAPPAN
jgi:membrane peptidoglycan carboxypeptidase